VRDTLLGAVATQLLQPGDEVVSLYHRRIEHGYPTPSLGRNAVLDQALPWLQEHNIWSRGRFGSYKVWVGGWDGSGVLPVCHKHGSHAVTARLAFTLMPHMIPSLNGVCPV